jgi:hypothetical protein
LKTFIVWQAPISHKSYLALNDYPIRQGIEMVKGGDFQFIRSTMLDDNPLPFREVCVYMRIIFKLFLIFPYLTIIHHNLCGTEDVVRDGSDLFVQQMFLYLISTSYLPYKSSVTIQVEMMI